MSSRQNQSPDSLPPQVFPLEAHKAGVVFAVAIVGFFAVMFLAGFLRKLAHLGPDEWALGLVGGTLLMADILLIRYFRRPAIVLAVGCMTLNGFFGARVVRYAELEELSCFLERIHPPLINGTRMPPRIIHRLLVKPRGKKQFRVTLPRFEFNTELIDGLEARSGMPVIRLPDLDKGMSNV